MAWDFSTEPEFQAKLDWARQFVADKVEPLDILYPHKQFHPLDDELRPIVDPMKQEVRDHDLWAAHLGPELGGKGYGQVKLALLNEILGRLGLGPHRVRDPGPRHRQRRDHRPLRDRGAEGEVPPAAPRRRGLLLLLDDRAPGRLGPPAVHLRGGAGRRRVGHQRLEVLLLQRPYRVLPHRHGHHRPRREHLPGGLDVPGPDRHPRGQHDPPRRPGRRVRGRGHARPHPLRGRAGSRPRTCWAGRARRSPSPRPGWAGAGSTTPCARWPPASGPSTCCASGCSVARPRAACWPGSSSSRATSPTPTPSSSSSASWSSTRRGRSTRSRTTGAPARTSPPSRPSPPRWPTTRCGARCTPTARSGCPTRCRSAACG